MVFSCKGIYLVVSFFQNRGHKDITVFVPQWRKEPSKPESPITDQEILFDLEKSNIISYTPSRRLRDKKIVCYDDRFIVRLATERGGVIVSNDHFKDLLDENEAWREVIENRLLMYTWVDDTFMVPSDPLGKHGPHLDVFLRFEGGKTPSTDSSSEHPIPRDKQPCPYKERCTFGPRCRYYHPGKEQKQPSSNGIQTSTSSRGGSPQSQSPSHNMRKEDLHSYQMSPTKQLGHLGVSGGGMYQYGNRLGSPLDIPGGLVAHQQQLPVDPYSSPYPSHHIRPPNTLARGMDRNFDMNCSPSPDLCPSFARVHGGMVPTVTPPPGQYYSPDQYIDHVRPTRRETAPLTQNTYINPSHPPRPHSALINTYPHTSNYYKHNQDSPHHQSIYEVAVRLFPSDQDRIQRILYQYPHINDLNVLIQYLTR
jgi:ribonuclease ZC3H12